MLEIRTNRAIAYTINDDPRKWNAEKIRDFYDQNPDLMLADLARFVGLTVPELKKVLMP